MQNETWCSCTEGHTRLPLQIIQMPNPFAILVWCSTVHPSSCLRLIQRLQVRLEWKSTGIINALSLGMATRKQRGLFDWLTSPAFGDLCVYIYIYIRNSRYWYYSYSCLYINIIFIIPRISNIIENNCLQNHPFNIFIHGFSPFTWVLPIEVVQCEVVGELACAALIIWCFAALALGPIGRS